LQTLTCHTSRIAWASNLIGYYGARDLVQFDTLENAPAWLDRALARPAVQRGVRTRGRRARLPASRVSA
jgi:GSH-dependent disulfide-bond oxidoreductase